MGKHFMILAISAAIVGCSAPDPAENAASATQRNDLAAVAPPAATGSEPAKAPPGQASTYVLAGNGLEPGLPFGTPIEEAVAAATKAFGPPTLREHNDECGEGAMDFVSFGALYLGFQDGKLAGWSLAEPKPALRTADGLAVGAPRSALGGAAVEESTLGQEFVVDDVSGVLSEDGKTIGYLWAGLACNFR